jgi:hypothetical protein
MTIKEIMQIGCDGMDEKQMAAEQERRLQVAEKVRKMGDRMAVADEKQKRKLSRAMNRIKADESVWLREAAWFMYA